MPLTIFERPGGWDITAGVSDGSGGLWVTGITGGAPLPTTPDAMQSTPRGGGDAFVMHLGADGRFIYATYIGGSQVDQAFAIVRDGSGNLYIAGDTLSPDFPITSGAAQRTYNTSASWDAFVMKLDPTAHHILYSTYLGGAGADTATGLAVDGSGVAHVVGGTEGTTYPVNSPWACHQYLNAFYTRISADGSAIAYSACLDDATANGVTLDSNGDAYVVGSAGQNFSPRMNPMPSQVTAPTNGARRAFLTKFSGTSIPFSTWIGGSFSDSASAVAVTSNGIYMSGDTYSCDFPGAPARGASGQSCGDAAFVTKVRLDGQAILGTTLLDGSGSDAATSLQVDSSDVAYVTGITTSTNFPVTSDAAQSSFGGVQDGFFATIPMPQNTAGAPSYVTYLRGGTAGENARAVALDAPGSAWVVGTSRSSDLPLVNPRLHSTDGAFAGHFGPAHGTITPAAGDIVLYARDASAASGWQLVDDSAAAGGARLWNPDAGAAKVTTPAASPANYFDLTFDAQAGVPYHFWLRMKADNDLYTNDSVWVQFSDSVDSSGNAIWRTGTTSGTWVSLEDCSGCGDQSWGWNDNGYGIPGTPVYFAATGTHTIRIQQREDGVSIDQVILSAQTWVDTAPGANKNDTSIVPQTATTPPPPPPPPANTPPQLTIASPSNGATFTAPATLTVSGTATDSDGSLTNVDIYINGQLKASSPPTNGQFSATWYQQPAGTYTFTVVATDNQGASTTSSVTVTVNAPSQGLPTGWTDADVGATGAAGSATYSNGTFTVQGAGADVWGSADAFNYVYLPLPADGWIKARVATVSSDANWVKAGVMIRSSLSPSSAQAFMLVSHAKGVAFQRRTVDGGTTVSTAGSASTAPHWVMLVRTADVIRGYESADGVTWAFVGTDTFTMPGTVLMGLAVSSHVYGTLATGTFDSVQTQVLPNGWADADIGSVPFAGTANWNAGTFTVTGSGADIWGTADAFNYTYHLLNGDGTIVAHVASVDNVSPWVKAGVMIRNTFDPGSVHAFVLVSSAKGVAFQRRQVAGGTSVSTAGSMSTAPHWVKLTRSGNTFTAYESSDGTTWTEIGSDTIPMAVTIYVGLAVTSHNTSASATCTFDHVSIQ